MSCCNGKCDTWRTKYDPYNEERATKAVYDLQKALSKAWDWEPELLKDLGISDEIYEKVTTWRKGDEVPNRDCE
jgi:hypothetical protein